MLISAVMDLAHALLDGMFNLLPDWNWTLPDSAKNLVGVLSHWNKLVPFEELMQISTIVVSIFGVMLALKVFKLVGDWLTSILP